MRLHDLRTHSLNGKVGVISNYDKTTGRYGVLLHGHVACKAFLPKNVLAYESLPGDTCEICNDLLNLNAIPPCSCRSERRDI